MICKKITSCEEKVNHPKRTFKDKKGGKSQYFLENTSKSNFFEIDFENCVYESKSNESRCDFGIRTAESIYYIELKGSDVGTGIEQLLNTISETESCFEGLSRKARLVITKFPKPDLVKKSKKYKDLVRKIGLREIVITQKVHTDKI